MLARSCLRSTRILNGARNGATGFAKVRRLDPPITHPFAGQYRPLPAAPPQPCRCSLDSTPRLPDAFFPVCSGMRS